MFRAETLKNAEKNSFYYSSAFPAPLREILLE